MAAHDNSKQQSAGLKQRIISFFKGDSYNIIFYIALLAVINIFAYNYNVSLDITSEGVYSLSDVSKSAVKNLSDPFTVKVFFSDNLPAPYSNVRLYLSDLLKEYDAAGGKNFSYQFMDMSDDDVKQSAEAYGVSPIQIQQRSNDEFSASTAYMGAVLIHGDLVETLDELTSSSGVEYMFTTAIQKMRSKVDLLAGLEDPIKVTLYVSDKLKAFNIGGLDQIGPLVEKTVESINEENSGKVEYSFKSDVTDDDILMLEKSYGMQVISIGDKKNGKGDAVDKAAFGITIQAGEKKTSISLGVVRTLFGHQIAGYENIGQKIHDSINLLLSNNPAVGYVVSGGTQDVTNTQNGAGVFKELISDMYEVESVDLLEGPVPEHIRTLVVNGPSEMLTDKELYYLDSFIMKGGNVLFFLDSYRQVNLGQQQMMMGQQPVFLPVKTGLDKLLASYGITVNQNYVLDEKCYADQQGDKYFIPMIDGRQLNKDNVVTKYLKAMVAVNALSLDIDAELASQNSLTCYDLVKTSDQSWIIDGRIDTQKLMMPSFDNNNKKAETIAMMVEGTFPSYFAGRSIEEIFKEKGSEESSINQNPSFKKAIAPSRIAVVGTSVLTNSPFILARAKGQSGDVVVGNTLFVHNLVDYLNDNEDVPEMRSKGAMSRLYDISDRSKFGFKMVNMVALPLLSIILGIVVWRMRTKRKKKIATMFSQEVVK